MTIEDIMWKTTAAVWESDSLEQAARTLAEQGLAGAIACDSEGGMVGVVAVEDVLFWPRAGAQNGA
ncbi:CBS domain protein [Geobacillus sp. BCO2]|nr:CBS domain protein [Geobacillus sp. BCO2]